MHCKTFVNIFILSLVYVSTFILGRKFIHQRTYENFFLTVSLNIVYTFFLLKLVKKEFFDNQENSGKNSKKNSEEEENGREQKLQKLQEIKILD